MSDLIDFFDQPESAGTFIQKLKTGKISMHWKEILAESEKFSNLQELTFGLMMQAIDNIDSLNSEKLIPLIGKIITPLRQLETSLSQNNTTSIEPLSKKFESAIQEFANLVNIEQAIESIRSLQADPDQAVLDEDPSAKAPFFTILLGLKMLVNAHEIQEFDEDNHACDDDECER